MPEIRHVTTVAHGPDDHMIGLGDVLVHDAQGARVVFVANGQHGGVLARSPAAGLEIRDLVDYAESAGLDAPRRLHLTDLGGATVLVATGRYGTLVETWEVTPAGTLGAARPLTLNNAPPGALLALDEAWLGGQHVFITSSSHAPGVQVWSRAEDDLYPVDQTGTTEFLAPGAVQALSIVAPGGVPHVLALDLHDHALTGFALDPGGALGAPVRLDLRDGLFVNTPTHLEPIQMGAASFALLGASGSSSLTVVALAPDGRMWVTDQVIDTEQTRFQNLAALDVLEAEGRVYVLAGGTDNGVSLLTLTDGGRLVHLASLGDEQREMALQGLSGLDMSWRADGLDIFVTGEVSPGQTLAGRGITELRIEGDGLVPTIHFSSKGGVYTGTQAADIFILNGAGQGDRVIGFEPGKDRLDLSGMGRFYSLDALDIRPMQTGAEIKFGEARVTIETADGSQLRAADFDFAEIMDLWHVSPDAPGPTAPMTMVLGSDGPDLVDGRGGDDILLGEPRDLPHDDVAAQVFRLYQATLDRLPDLRGLVNWTKRLQTGEMDLPEVVAGFTQSAEFRQTYGATDNHGFVTLLYENVLERAPDAQGLVNWTGRLDRAEMDRTQAVLGFAESAEFRETTAAGALAYSKAGLQAGFSDDVFRLYQATLDRSPDSAGLYAWTDRLANGMSLETVVAGFTNSAEFLKTYGTTDSHAFVTLLYDNVLGRAPDARGLANWTGRLDRAEMDRAQVVIGFSQSAEFIAKSTSDLREWLLSQGTDDILDGGGGNDTLMGGLGSDMFVFRRETGGSHVVVDPEPWDRLDLHGFGYDRPADLGPHLSQDGADTLLSDQGVTIRFLDSTPADIQDLDMIF